MPQPSVKFMAPSSSPVRSLVLTLSSYASSSLVGTLICGIENGALLRYLILSTLLRLQHSNSASI